MPRVLQLHASSVLAAVPPSAPLSRAAVCMNQTELQVLPPHAELHTHPFASCLQAKVEQARKLQLQASDVLARLLQAPDPTAVADQYVDSMNEEFFAICDSYIAMVGGGVGGQLLSSCELIRACGVSGSSWATADQ